MVMELKRMTGEQLLLVSVLGDSKVQDIVDRELDRRAILGPLSRLGQRKPWAKPVPRHAA